jgi:MFS family permease
MPVVLIAHRSAQRIRVEDQGDVKRRSRHPSSMSLRRALGIFHGWRVVAVCFVVAAFGWGLGLFGSSVYLQAVTRQHGWAVTEVASAITLFFLVSAVVQRTVGRSIDRWGPRPVLSLGTVAIAVGVALIGQVNAPWQLYPCFVLVGIGWSTLSTTGISATVAPWFERHQGRSITLAIMGASVGAIAGRCCCWRWRGSASDQGLQRRRWWRPWCCCR